jgi:AcrR family transcriptional regulator
VPRTQEERRADTRARLLDAAAELFAEHGIAGASVDAIAETAGRTSGSIYAHFGGKEGLLTAVVDGWKDAVAAGILADFARATSVRDQLRALWRNFADPPRSRQRAGGGWRWLELEHELWLHASRRPDARDRLAARYEQVRAPVERAVREWTDRGDAAPPVPANVAATQLVGFLIGLEMQHRVDPDAVTDDTAVDGACALLGIATSKELATT